MDTQPSTENDPLLIKYPGSADESRLLHSFSLGRASNRMKLQRAEPSAKDSTSPWCAALGQPAPALPPPKGPPRPSLRELRRALELRLKLQPKPRRPRSSHLPACSKGRPVTQRTLKWAGLLLPLTGTSLALVSCRWHGLRKALALRQASLSTPHQIGTRYAFGSSPERV